MQSKFSAQLWLKDVHKLDAYLNFKVNQIIYVSI